LKSNNPPSTRSEKDSRLLEWFDKVKGREPEIIPDESNNNKYYILGGLLILSLATWYFWDDIKPVTTGILASIQSLWRRPENDPGNNPTNSGNNIPVYVEQPISFGDRIRSGWEWVKSKFSRSNPDVINPNNDRLREDVTQTLKDRATESV
jgi:hypothetical protein